VSFFCGIFHFDGRPVSHEAVADALKAYEASWMGQNSLQGKINIQDEFGTGKLRCSRSLPSDTSYERSEDVSHQHFAVNVGELRYRDQLKSKLGLTTHVCHERTDEQLIIAAWRKWGADCVDHIRGDCAFAIFDRDRRELNCFQSLVALNPLYFVHTDHFFAFASRIRPLIALAGLQARLNEKSFADAISLSFFNDSAEKKHGASRVSTGETMYQGVRSLLGSSRITVRSDASLRIERWWRPDVKRRIRLASDQAYVERARELVLRSVGDHVRDGSQTACTLSGGLDSSTIAAVAALKLKEQGERLTTLTGVLPERFEGPERDEREFAQSLVESYDCRASYVSPDENAASCPKPYMNFYERPISNPTLYLDHAIVQAAKQQGATKLLYGDYGEAGITNHGIGAFAWLARHGQWRRLAVQLKALSRLRNQKSHRAFLRHAAGPYFPRLMVWSDRKRYGELMEHPIELPIRTEVARQFGISRNFDNMRSEARLIAAPDPRKHMEHEILHWLQAPGPRNESMVLGVQAGHPFLDRDLLEFCLAVPPHIHWTGGWERSLVRHAMEGILPPKIQWRTCKAPFSPDYFRRMKTAHADIREELNSIGPNETARDYFDVDAVVNNLEFLNRSVESASLMDTWRARFGIQYPLSCIRFLRWFDGEI
jgi:asparagine synthase (glutamine-hydrolysing)